MRISDYNDILKILVSHKGYVKVIEPTDSSHCLSKSAKPIDSIDPNGPVFPGALMQAPHGKSLEYKYYSRYILVGGLNPSEKSESQLGLLFPTCGKIIHSCSKAPTGIIVDIRYII